MDALFEHAPVGLAFVDTDLRYVKVNAAVAAIAGRPVEEYVGRTVREIYPGLADKIEPAMRSVIDTGRASTGETLSGTLPGQPGGARHFRIGRYPVRDENGAIIGVGTVVDDVTALRDAEEHMERLLERERVMRAEVEQARLELERANTQLSELARSDPLTGLANRRLFAEQLDAALARTRRTGLGLAVIWLDLDNFKRINDEHGHAAGDALLQAVARRLRAGARETDLIARLGGDEFLVLAADLPVADLEHVSSAIAQRMLHNLSEPLIAAGATLRIDASIGISHYPTHAATATELLARADAAMYQSKRTRPASQPASA